MRENVEKINPTDTGVFEVYTQGSMHVWNMNQKYYVKFPGAQSTTAEMFHQDEQNSLRHVEVWPEVGNVFLVTGLNANRISGPSWHRSSIIKEIVRIA